MHISITKRDGRESAKTGGNFAIIAIEVSHSYRILFLAVLE